MIYLIPLIFISIFVYHYDYRGNNRHKLLCYNLLLLAFILIAGFRYRIGGDSLLYENYYEWSPGITELTLNYFSESRFSPGYLILQSIPRTFTSDFMWFQLLHSTIVCGIIFWFFYTNTKKPFVAILIFYLMLYLNLLTEVLRESLAVCMFLVAWPMFRDSKWLKYYICSVIALSFHISAAFMLLLPLLLLPGIRNLFVFGKRQLITLPILLLIGLIVSMMFYKYIELLSISETVTERAQVYSKHESFGRAILNPLGIMAYLCRYLMYGMLAIYFINKRKGLNSSNIWEAAEGSEGEEKRELSRLEFLFLVGSCFVIMTIPIFIFNRFNNYFLPITIILVSRWVFTDLRLSRRTIRLNIVYWALLFSPLVYFQYAQYNQPVQNNEQLRVYMKYYPYASRFDRTINNDREAVLKYTRTL